MKSTLLLLIFAAMTLEVNAQLPFYWARTGDTAYSGFCKKMVTDVNGNIYVGSSPSSQNNTFSKVIKYDQYGNPLWIVCDTGAGLGVYLNDICIDTGNNLYVAGQQENPGNSTDAFLSKYDGNGQLIWKRYYNGNANGKDIASTISLFNSCIYLAGSTVGLQNQARLLMQKYDLNGNLIWTVTDSLNEQWNNYAFYITHDNSDLIVTGMVWHSQIQYNMFLVKYDQLGNKIWQTFDSLSALQVYGTKIVIDHQQNIYVAINDGVPFNLLQYDSLGRFKWKYGISPGSFTVPTGIADVKLDDNDNVYLSGSATIAGGFDGISAFVFTKLRSNGSVAGTYVGQNSGYGAGFDFLSQNDIVVSGSLDSTGYEIIDFDSSVNIKWQHYYTSDVADANCSLVVVDSMKNILLAGSWNFNQVYNHPLTEVMKYGSNTFVNGIDILGSSRVAVRFFPNPGSAGNVRFVVGDDLTGGNLQMFDLTGKLMQQLPIMDTNFMLNTSNFSSGIYFYRVCGPSGHTAGGKLVVE